MREDSLKICLIVPLLFITLPCFAQSKAQAEGGKSALSAKAEKYFAAGEKYFKLRRYKKALKYFYTAAKYKKDGLETWKKIAFCYYQLKKHKYAYNAFQQVLKLDKDDKEAKEFMEFYRSVMEKEKKKKEKREMFDSLWRAAVFPGWGQFHNNQTVKGIIAGGGFITAAGVALYNVIDEKARYEKYLNTNENHEMAYKEAQDAWNAALIWTIIAGVIYAGGVVDAALSYDSIEARTAGIKVKGSVVYLCAEF